MGIGPGSLVELLQRVRQQRKRLAAASVFGHAQYEARIED